ncbi:NUMOD4 motif-containing HNH endonuclease [Paracandidimonas lactea]|uniref:NUMOD4 motif-containing HNH endonuclease n=1 Tax=Paracandidimonas lactea TaxID=2895524 RepID=UPI0034E23E23
MIFIDSQTEGNITMPDTLNENWLPVPGYEGLYSVSDLGRVRSERRIIPRAGSEYVQPERILKPSNDGKGYFRVNLSRNAKPKVFYIHQLVMLSFVGPQSESADVCHADGDTSNNRLSNLRYDTRAANIVDSQRHGTFSEAEVHPCAILTNEQALTIYHTTGVPADDLANAHGVSAAVILQIWRGETWKSVTGGIDVVRKRGRQTYLRTKLTSQQADYAISNRESRTGRKDGKGIKPTAIALGVDADVIRAFYAALDARKPIIYAE